MSEEKTKVIDLLNEMIEASKANTDMGLNMNEWYCKTACCACGDTAIYRDIRNNVSNGELLTTAMGISRELDDAFKELMGPSKMAGSIYEGSPTGRKRRLTKADVATKALITHPHINTDHSDRSILIDYIEQVIKYIEVNYE